MFVEEQWYCMIQTTAQCHAELLEVSVGFHTHQFMYGLNVVQSTSPDEEVKSVDRSIEFQISVDSQE